MKCCACTEFKNSKNEFVNCKLCLNMLHRNFFFNLFNFIKIWKIVNIFLFNFKEDCVKKIKFFVEFQAFDAHRSL